MAKGIFVTGTGTDVGKTYVTALIVKKLADACGLEYTPGDGLTAFFGMYVFA